MKLSRWDVDNKYTPGNEPVGMKTKENGDVDGEKAFRR